MKEQPHSGSRRWHVELRRVELFQMILFFYLIFLIELVKLNSWMMDIKHLEGKGSGRGNSTSTSQKHNKSPEP